MKYALLPLLLLTGCGAAKNPHVLLLTLDTTRADHLGCYGNTRGLTPNLDRLAAEGVLFEDAQSVMPLTTPTHATILTGRLPIEHGIRLNREGILPPEIPTLADIFKANGYATAAFVATRILDAKFGLSRGFDLYDGEKPGARLLSRPADEISSAVMDWIDARPAGGQPFFVWAHYYDPHIPRTPHPDLFPALTNAYESEIAFMDLHVGRLLDHLRARGLLDNTLVIAVADHGESLGEHDELFHGYFIYQGTQHVPMIFRWPGHVPAGRRVPGSVSLNDLMPTILGLARVDPGAFAKKGTPPHTELDPVLARSFADAVTGRTAFTPRPCHRETLWPFYYFGWSPLSGVVEDGWSYVRAPEPELYNLDVDPGETNNLFGADPRRADDLAMRLEVFERDAVRHEAAPATVSPEELRRFASLGYLSGNSAALKTLAATNRLSGLANPKSKSRLVLAHNRQSLYLGGSRPADDELLSDCLLLVAEFPEKPGYLIQAGRARLSRGEKAEALACFEKAETLSPTNTVVRRYLEQLRGK